MEIQLLLNSQWIKQETKEKFLFLQLKRRQQITCDTAKAELEFTEINMRRNTKPPPQKKGRVSNENFFVF